jgi:hypothetical protein
MNRRHVCVLLTALVAALVVDAMAADPRMAANERTYVTVAMLLAMAEEGVQGRRTVTAARNPQAAWSPLPRESIYR